MQPVFFFLHLDMLWGELHSHMLLQQGARFFILLESNCSLFVTYCHGFRNKETYDGFGLTVEQEPPIWLPNHAKELR